MLLFYQQARTACATSDSDPSIRNRQSSSLPICSHSPLRPGTGTVFCFRYQNTNFPFPSFLGPEHPAFSEIQRNFFGSARSSFGKTGSVWTNRKSVSQLRIKAALLNILQILIRNMLCLPQMNRYAIHAWNFLRP